MLGTPVILGLGSVPKPSPDTCLVIQGALHDVILDLPFMDLPISETYHLAESEKEMFFKTFKMHVNGINQWFTIHMKTYGVIYDSLTRISKKRMSSYT